MAKADIQALSKGKRFFLLTVNPRDVQEGSALELISFDYRTPLGTELVTDKKISGLFRKRIELTTYFRGEDGVGIKCYVSDHHLRHYGEKLVALTESRTIVHSVGNYPGDEYIKIKNTLEGAGL